MVRGFRQGNPSVGNLRFSDWCQNLPPSKILRNLGHFLLSGSAANIFLLWGGTGARVLHVKISHYATPPPFVIATPV